MPATDNVLVVLQRLVTLVSGSADFWTAMKAGRPSMTGNPTSNFIHSDDGRRTWLEAINKQNRRTPAAFPAVFLLPPTSSREAPGAFNTFCARHAQTVETFTFRVLGEGTDIVAIGQVAAEIEAALKATGLQLGIPATVAMWRCSGRTYPDAPRDLSPDTTRRMAVIPIEVTIKG